MTRHAVALNPFASVRGRKHDVVDGKTPELTIQRARALLRSLVMVVTDLLGQNVPMEDVQYLAGHANPQTTQISNIVERISV